MNVTDPVDILARTVWGEARSDGRPGMEAVACVVLNRAHNPRWWGHDILSVCLDPWQFSCWNEGDPNLPKMRVVDGADPSFVTALAVAADAVAGRLVDATKGADSYYAVGTPAPSWIKRASSTCVILRHSFWRVELPAPGGGADAGAVKAVDPAADDLNAAELSSINQTS